MPRVSTPEAIRLEITADKVAERVCPCRVTAPLAGHDPDRSIECAHVTRLVRDVLRVLDGHGVDARVPEPKPTEFRVVGTWLVEVVDECTCGCGGPVPHEPGCGMEPVVDLARLMPIPSGPEYVIEANALDQVADDLGDTQLTSLWDAIAFVRAAAKTKRENR